ncbi:hypothetical protein [Actinomadura sp. 9N215]|uniref:hypothetical protein n=1 Tax=Actinomadura sp. 9N215 TaxID=3375150 RepID=UPI0037AA8A3A
MSVKELLAAEVDGLGELDSIEVISVPNEEVGTLVTDYTTIGSVVWMCSCETYCCCSS